MNKPFDIRAIADDYGQQCMDPALGVPSVRTLLGKLNLELVLHRTTVEGLDGLVVRSAIPVSSLSTNLSPLAADYGRWPTNAGTGYCIVRLFPKTILLNPINTSVKPMNLPPTFYYQKR